MRLLSIACILLLSASNMRVRGQNTTESFLTADTGGCDVSSYMVSLDYELSNGLLEAEARCDEAMRMLASMRFGPPSEHDIFEATCKGPCQEFAARVDRQQASADPPCDCQKLKRAGYFTFKCRNPNTYLCRRTGYCLDYAEYWKSYCTASACGRWATNEDDWRTSRIACGAAGTLVSGAALLLTAALFLFQQGRG